MAGAWFDELERLGDAELVARARDLRGGGAREVEQSKRCLALVFERHREAVRVACAARAPREAVADLEQQVYERFVRFVHTSDERLQHPVGLLVRLAQWAVADLHERRRLRPEELDDEPERHSARREDGAGGLLAERAFLELLAPLSERQRQVVALRIGLDLSSAATAEELGISPGNVDVILHRALTRLRRELSA